MAVVREGQGEPIAILNRNEPAFYCISAKGWEKLMEQLEDLELLKKAVERVGESTTKVSLDEL